MLATIRPAFHLANDRIRSMRNIAGAAGALPGGDGPARLPAPVARHAMPRGRPAAGTRAPEVVAQRQECEEVDGWRTAGRKPGGGPASGAADSRGGDEPADRLLRRWSRARQPGAPGGDRDDAAPGEAQGAELHRPVSLALGQHAARLALPTGGAGS